MTSENENLEAIRAGDERAWADVHRDHFSRLWNSVNRMVQNPSLSDDIVQEAFVKAYREIDRFQGQSKFSTWLYRIAINQALDHVRKQSRRERWLSFLSPLAEDDAPAPLPEAPVDPMADANLKSEELREAIGSAMAELSPEHRAAVQLRLIDEMSLEEAAKLMKCKPGTVNSRLHYACEYLRRKLRVKLAAV